MPDHYGWKNPVQITLIKEAYRAVAAGSAIDPVFAQPEVTDQEAEQIVKSLDSEGRWMSVHKTGAARLVGQPKFQDGENFLSSAVFSENMRALSRYLAAASR